MRIVARQLETVRLILVPKFRIGHHLIESADAHGAELVDAKNLAIFADTVLGKKRASGAAQRDNESDHELNRK